MIEITPFPKIWHLGTKELVNLFEGNVEVTEKIDGSQFGFALLDGELHLRSKGQTIHPPAVQKLFTSAVNYVISVKDRLLPGYCYYGEVLCKPRHNTLQYERIPLNGIALFGVRDTNGNFISNHASLKEYADQIGVDVVPLVHNGLVTSLEQVKEWLNQTSYLGREKIEGVVLKNYGQLAVSAFSRECFGKLVREEFKERNGAEHISKKNTINDFLESFKSPVRWEKAIQHLRDDGKITNSPKDIGVVIMEVHRDLLVEENQYIKDALYKMYERDIKSYSTAGFPEWYKTKIAERAFNEETKAQ